MGTPTGDNSPSGVFLKMRPNPRLHPPAAAQRTADFEAELSGRRG